MSDGMEQPGPYTTLVTLSKRMQYLAENDPDKEMFVFYEGNDRTSFTCEQIFQLSGKFANRLRHRYGFKRNDVIANTLTNSPERVITDLGITLAGCACLNGQILLADGSDFFQTARNSRCSGIVLKPSMDSPAWRIFHPYITEHISSTFATLSCDQTPDLRSAICVSRTAEGNGKPWLEELKDSSDEVFVDSTVGPDDLLYVFTTSGSTGYSKLVPRTHAEIVNYVIAFSDTNSFYCDNNLGWFGGYPFRTYCFGVTQVLQDWFNQYGKKTGEQIWKTICREKCSTAFIHQNDVDSVVTYINGIGGTDYKLQTLYSGGQPMTKSQLAGKLKMAEKVFHSYGSTESGGLTRTSFEDTKAEDFFCGKVLPGIKLKIVNENGDECQPREVGTILVQGAIIFKGYFNRLEDPDPNTVTCFTKDGWFKMEDLGFQDEDGNLYVMGRNKDTITYGSAVLYPGWLEAEILQHPDIADAVVLPVSDPVLFHEICACVSPVSGCDFSDEQLKAYCESIFIADLANDKTPMPKYFMVLESFPQTPTGKPDKQKLREMAEEKFGTGRNH